MQTTTPTDHIDHLLQLVRDDEDRELADLASRLKPLLALRGGRGPQHYSQPQLLLWAEYIGLCDGRGESTAQIAARLDAADKTIQRQRRRLEGRRIRNDHIPLAEVYAASQTHYDC